MICIENQLTQQQNENKKVELCTDSNAYKREINRENTFYVKTISITFYIFIKS